MEPTSTNFAKESHADLIQSYKRHGRRLEAMWRSFDKAQRTRCLRAGSAEGVVLKHPLDASLGNVYKFIPEWNLHQITEPGSDFLLDILKHRATTTLEEQYIKGVNNGPGDYEHIMEMVQKKNLRHVDTFEDCYTFFIAERYGESFRFTREKEATLAAFAPAIKARLLIPQNIGELVLNRQAYLLQLLNTMIEDILDLGSDTRDRKQRPKDELEKGVDTAFSSLTVQDKLPTATSLLDVIAAAQDRKAAFEDRVDLLSCEPVVLAYLVNLVFFSRAELVPDEKGRVLPVHTNKHISAAFFEAVNRERQAATIWRYITQLVELLQDSALDKVYRSLILQELSNVCQMEYSRTQALLKRHLAVGSGPRRFRRIANAFDKAGNPRLALKCNPETLTRSDRQFHHLLRLCQVETTALQAADYMKQLGSLYATHPSERERLEECQAEALFDLAIITSFLRDISSILTLPTASRKKGWVFLRAFEDLESKFAPLRKEIDLTDYAAPIDHLLEPGMAASALGAFETFLRNRTGSGLEQHYDTLIAHSLALLRDQYEQAMTQKEENKRAQQQKDIEAAAFPSWPEEGPRETPTQSRREKIKTRPAHPSSSKTSPPDIQGMELALALEPISTIRVSASAGEVFGKLFNKSQARGSISWVAFESAMAELQFSVFPKYGSIYTFQPPPSSEVKKPFTIHRPHQAQIEGYRLLVLSKRLNRTYGWRQSTFEVV